MNPLFLTSLLVIASSPWSVNGACKKRTPIDFDESSLGQQPAGGWYVPMSDDYSPQSINTLMSSGSGSVKAPSGSRKRCVNVPISDGTVLLNMQCECLSDEDNKQECTCYKPANLMLVPEKAYVKNIVTKSDGETYAVIITCMNGGAGYTWFVLSNKKELDAKTQQQIKAHLKKEGLSGPTSELPAPAASSASQASLSNGQVQKFKPRQLKTIDCSKLKKGGAPGFGEMGGFPEFGEAGSIPGLPEGAADKYGYGFAQPNAKSDSKSDP